LIFSIQTINVLSTNSQKYDKIEVVSISRLSAEIQKTRMRTDMDSKNHQKIKLLKIYEMLRQETDEQHPMKTHEICERLYAQGISCDRRTLAKDMKVLNEQGFEVMQHLIGHEKAYYIEDRSFSTPELKILMDAVQAASFITDKKSKELITKIAVLGGSHCAEILTGNLVQFNTRKHTNEYIYYSVECLETAIRCRKKASFLYFHMNENHNKVFHRDGQRYIVEPVALVYYQDNYYLMCYNAEEEELFNYRVDRMEAVETENEAVSVQAKKYMNSVSDYTEQVFKMYGGEMEKVVLLFDESLTGVIYDKFGEQVEINRANDTQLSAAVNVQISPTFWGWLFQFVGRMHILAPQSVKEEYLSRLRQATEEAQKDYLHV